MDEVPDDFDISDENGQYNMRSNVVGLQAIQKLDIA